MFPFESQGGKRLAKSTVPPIFLKQTSKHSTASLPFSRGQKVLEGHKCSGKPGGVVETPLPVFFSVLLGFISVQISSFSNTCTNEYTDITCSTFTAHFRVSKTDGWAQLVPWQNCKYGRSCPSPPHFHIAQAPNSTAQLETVYRISFLYFPGRPVTSHQALLRMLHKLRGLEIKHESEHLIQ